MPISQDSQPQPALRLGLFSITVVLFAGAIWYFFIRSTEVPLATGPAPTPVGAVGSFSSPKPAKGVGNVKGAPETVSQPRGGGPPRSRAEVPAATAIPEVTPTVAPAPITTLPAPVEPVPPPPPARPALARAAMPSLPPGSSIFYDATSTGVVPPVLLTPVANSPIRSSARHSPESAAIEILVNADGSVLSVNAAAEPATVGAYLEMVNGLTITKSWQFKPATRNGQPVPYLLLVPLRTLLVGRGK